MTKPAVLLVNLGSPDSPSVPDVRRYLREFLMDPRVLDMPYPIRFAVVNFAILPRRPRASAEAYRKIWTADGSPLVVMGRRVRALLEERLGLPVALAMRYQNPSIASALEKLSQLGVERILLIPLFPHYALSSYETAAVEVKRQLKQIAPACPLDTLPPFYDQPDYIAALVSSAAEYLKQPYDHLLFSFHGLPERHLRKSDPTGAHCLASPDCCQKPGPALATCYRAQAFATVRAFVQRAGIPTGKFSVAFQSRLGRDPWLKPYTDHELPRLAESGVRRVLVICPAFVADCLETLEEIGLRGRELFLASGGGDLQLIPCLNDSMAWIEALENMTRTTLANHPAAASNLISS